MTFCHGLKNVEKFSNKQFETYLYFAIFATLKYCLIKIK